ncbi:hypothetical protein EPZ47_12775 [Pseudomonas viciae]|uniref:Uncharacterized protein n=1 Tax=Pseudomonas viciae TaxID=2505979 RepID=A0A4P7PG05_9PSED|nr:hypothetical protein EPZ47_12775 [Pseudomonas viciae]
MLTQDPLWERACSRRLSVRQPFHRLTHRFREQARSHNESKPITILHARQNPVSRHTPPCIKVTTPAPALSERPGPPFPGTVTDGTS